MASASATIPVGYKQTDVGVIPNDWVVKSLIETCNYVDYRGRTPPKSDRGRVLVTSRNIREGRIDYERSKEYISESTYGEYMKRGIPIIGDVLITTEAPLGMIAQVDNDAIALAQRVIKYRPKAPSLNSKFLMYFLLSNSFQQQLKANAIGSTASGIKGSILHRLLVSFPSNIDEQYAISEALYDIDTQIESLENLIAKKRDFKQGTMQELLTGKARLPRFSGEWETSTLKDLVDLIPSGIYGFETKTDNLIEMPVATTAHISMSDKWNNKKMNNRFFTNQQVHDYSPKLGDLVVVKSSGSAASIQSGKMAFVDSDTVGKFIFSNFLMLLRPIGCDTKYLFYQLTSSRVKMMIPFLVESSTYPNIRIEDYMDIEVPLPNNSEQEAIAEVLSDMDAEIAALEQRLEKTKAIKQGMMQQLLTGRIRLVDPSTPVEANE
jgi:type I restriction enzyme, S subunit